MTEVADKPAAAVEAPRAAVAAPAASATVTPPVVPPPHVQVRVEPRRPGKFRRFVRSVFSHLIFAALVTAGVFGYVYQDMILGRVATTVCGNDALGPYAPGGSKSAAATPSAVAPSSIARVPVPASTPPPAVAAAPVPATTPDVRSAASREPASKVADAAPSAVSTPSAGVAASHAKAATSTSEPAKTETAKPEPAKVAPAVSAPAAPSAIVAAIPATPAGQSSAKPAVTAPTIERIAPPAPAQAPASATAPPAATSAKPGAAPATPVSQDALASAWRAAREAFNAGKPDAIDAYKSLLRSYPDVPDLAGELGNIYYAAGKWREASESYYEAALRYLKSPQPGYAACLLDVLRNLRSPEAERLSPQITRPCPTARAGQPGQNTGQTASNPPRG